MASPILSVPVAAVVVLSEVSGEYGGDATAHMSLGSDDGYSVPFFEVAEPKQTDTIDKDHQCKCCLRCHGEPTPRGPLRWRCYDGDTPSGRMCGPCPCALKQHAPGSNIETHTAEVHGAEWNRKASDHVRCTDVGRHENFIFDLSEWEQSNAHRQSEKNGGKGRKSGSWDPDLKKRKL